MTDSQPQSPEEALQRAVRDLGRRVSENPDRVRAALSDGLGAAGREHRAAIDALALASEEGIPATLLAREDSVLTETDLVDDDHRLVVRLTDRGLDRDVAAFAIGTWAMALGTDSTLTSASSLGPVGALSSGSAAAGTPEATQLPFVVGISTEETPPLTDAPGGATAGGAGGTGGTGGTVGGVGGVGEGDHQGRGNPMAPRVARVRRGLVAAAVAATLAVVGGTAWSSFRTPSRDAALLVDAKRTSTSAGPSTTTGPAITTAPPPATTTAPPKRPTTAATTKKPVVKTSAPLPAKTTPRPVTTTPRTTPRSSASPAPARTTPKKTSTSKSSTPRSSTSTKPKPPPPPPAPPPAPKTLTAGNGTHSWTMSYWDGASCLAWAGAGAQVCSRYVNTIKGGTVSTWQVADAVSVNGHGDVVVSGQRVQYFPHHNGYIQDVIRYRLSGAGVTSNWATLTVTAYCNTNYACFGE